MSDNTRATRQSRGRTNLIFFANEALGANNTHPIGQASAGPKYGCVQRQVARKNRRTVKTSGGARRDRTDDLLLAKQALSQLSYGPDQRTEDGQQWIDKRGTDKRISAVRRLNSAVR
jgi:hypothetical protein